MTTLLVMSLIAALAVALMDQVKIAVKRASHVQAYAQADWYAQGAEEFALFYLQDQLQQYDVDAIMGALNPDQPVIFPFEGGAMALNIRDGNHCLPINLLGEGLSAQLFQNLLSALGVDQQTAERLSYEIIDWQDDNSQIEPGGAEDFTYLGFDPAYRTANIPMHSLTELRLVNLMDEAQYQYLRPFLCVRPGETDFGIHINTLSPKQAPILAAFLGGGDWLLSAEQLIAERPAEGYEDWDDLMRSSVLDNQEPPITDQDRLIFSPADKAYIWMEAHIDYLKAHRRMAFEFAINSEKNSVMRIYRGVGDEAFRPRFETDTISETEEQ